MQKLCRKCEEIMKITALQEVLQSCLELSLRTGLIELPAPARLVDMCEQHRQKIQMTALIDRSQTNNALRAFATAELNRLGADSNCYRQAQDAILRFRMCQQHSFPQQHIVAMFLCQCNDLIHIGFMHKTVLQQRLKGQTEGILPVYSFLGNSCIYFNSPATAAIASTRFLPGCCS